QLPTLLALRPLAENPQHYYLIIVIMTYNILVRTPDRTGPGPVAGNKEQAMTDTNTPATPTDAPAAPAAGGKASRKPADAPTGNDALTANEAKVLGALAKAKAPLTRKDLAAATGINKGWSRLLGAATREGGGAAGKDGLEARGLVKCEPGGDTRAL